MTASERMQSFPTFIHPDLEMVLRENPPVENTLLFRFQLQLAANCLDYYFPLPNERLLERREICLTDKEIGLLRSLRTKTQRTIETHGGESSDFFRSYDHYFQYILWRAGAEIELPSLSALRITTSLLELIPDVLHDFHLRILPYTHFAVLDRLHQQGVKVEGARWHDIISESTRRQVTAGLCKDLTSDASDFPNEYTKWRIDYLETAKALGLEMKDSQKEGAAILSLELPAFGMVKKDLYLRLQKIMSVRDAKTLVVGVSGDLDSAFMLTALSEVIRDYDLPFKIKAYKLAKNYHKSRVRRVEELINYLNREREVTPIVEYEQFNFVYAYNLLIHALYTGQEGSFSQPTIEFAKQAIRVVVEASTQAINTLTRDGTRSQKIRRRKNYGIAEESPIVQAIADIITRADDPQKLVSLLQREVASLDVSSGLVQLVPPDQLIHLVARLIGENDELFAGIGKQIDSREQSNLIHELLIAVRGYLCRKERWPLAVSGQNATESAFYNLTTSDTFVAWWPLSRYPKELIANAFREFIQSTDGQVVLREWEVQPLKTLVPWYPNDTSLLTLPHGRKILRRSSYYVQEFTEVELDSKLSGIPVEVLEGIKQIPDQNYVRMDGNVQWYLDPYMHYFMIHGLSQKSVETLCHNYPSRKTDILFTAFLMAGAWEMRQKSRYIQNVLTE